MSRNSYAIVTGPSGGIGFEIARLLAKDKYNLILISRNIDKLDAVKAEFEKDFSISVITIKKDLSVTGSSKEIFDEIKTKNLKVTLLINNAGFGDFGSFAECDLNKQLRMMQLNIVSLTELTRLFIPELIHQKEGKILNLASVAAFMPGPMMSVYYASKAFVLSFNEAIAYELKGTGVTATALCPGPTNTKFFDAAEVDNPKFKKLLKIADSASVALYGYKAMKRGKVVAIPGLMNKFIICLIRFTPRFLVRYSIGKLSQNQS